MKFVPWGFSQGAAKIKIEQVEFEQKEITDIGSVPFRPETDDEVREKSFLVSSELVRCTYYCMAKQVDLSARSIDARKILFQNMGHMLVFL